jgi:hypothetical protein
MRCDLCGIAIGNDSKRYTPSQMLTAVHGGLKLPADLILAGALAGASEKEIKERWVARVQNDPKDWAMCRACAKQVDKCKRRENIVMVFGMIFIIMPLAALVMWVFIKGLDKMFHK